MLTLLRIVTLSLTIVTATFCINAFAEDKTFQVTSDSGILYDLNIKAEALEAMKPLPVMIKLSGPDGTPISGADITCSLSMPAMAMSNNTPSINESNTAGQYEGVFLITMGGLWEVTLTSMYDSGNKEVVVFSFYGVNTVGVGSDVDSKLEKLFQEKRAAHN